MASQIANDLEAQARRLEGTGQDHLVRSLKRGAETICNHADNIADLEAAAEDAENRLIAYQNGDDLYREE